MESGAVRSTSSPTDIPMEKPESETALKEPEPQDEKHIDDTSKVTFRERILHFTWAWFTVPLSTAGMGILLAATPHRFDGLTTIGKIFFILALVTYVAAVVLITARFVMDRSAIRCSLTHPHEALFFPTSVLSLANLLSCAQIYGAPSTGEWFVQTMRVLFWIYIAIAFCSSGLQYLHLFAAPATRLTIQGMTPAWILPVFPLLLSGTLAGIVATNQPVGSAITIVIAGVTYTGIGWMIAFLMFAIYIHRLMQFGLPPPNLRPGMFISVGPPGFTALGLIGLANNLPLLKDYGYFAANPQAIGVLVTLADWVAIFLWTLAAWFFCVTLIAVLLGARQVEFHLIWWALVFPNIALVVATARIGERLKSEGIMWISSVMTILLVAAWIIVFALNIRAALRKDIMMPGKDEDKDFYKKCHAEHKLVPSPPKLA